LTLAVPIASDQAAFHCGSIGVAGVGVGRKREGGRERERERERARTGHPLEGMPPTATRRTYGLA